MRSAIFVIVLLTISSLSYSAIIEVPKDYINIQDAIDASINGDIVLVSSGLYYENIDFKGKAITVKSKDGAKLTTIDGGAVGSVAVFTNSETNGSVLDGFTLTNGIGAVSPIHSNIWFGGAVFCESFSSPTIINNIIIKNTASLGGGVHCSMSNPVIKNNTIKNNMSTYGGGICCYESSSPTIENNSISDNYGVYGGGVCCRMFSDPTIKNNCIFKNRTIGGAGPGGGIYCSESSPDIIGNTITDNRAFCGGGISCQYTSSPKIDNNTISRNCATSLGTIFFRNGGGIYCSESYSTISNNVITHNLATDEGGGIYCDDCYSQSIINNNISDNSAYWGGGFFCRKYSNPDILNNSFINNRATSTGGGGVCDEYSSPLIQNNIFICNKVEYGHGGGLYCFSHSTPKISNCTFTKNSATLGPCVSCAINSTAEIINCIIWDNGSNSINGHPNVTYSVVEGGYVGNGNISANPGFVIGQRGFLYLSQKAAGQPFDSPCLNSGSGPAISAGMDIYWTRTDKVPDSGLVDMGFHYGPFRFLSFMADSYSISASTGGSVNFVLCGNTPNANRKYLIFSGVTGTNSKTLLPGGKATIPLKWDMFTDFVLANINMPFFSKFMGQLDNYGSSVAAIDTFGPLGPSAVGIKMHFAYALNKPWDFGSDLVSLEITP